MSQLEVEICSQHFSLSNARNGCKGLFILPARLFLQLPGRDNGLKLGRITAFGNRLVGPNQAAENDGFTGVDRIGGVEITVQEGALPGLRDIPVIGLLFGKTITSEVRTELVIMLSPRIIRNPSENNEVLREYKAKFKNIEFDQN